MTSLDGKPLAVEANVDGNSKINKKNASDLAGKKPPGPGGIVYLAPSSTTLYKEPFSTENSKYEIIPDSEINDEDLTIYRR